MAAKTSSMGRGGSAMAAPSATAMKGAVQGVATSTANAPVKKLPAWPWRAWPESTGPAMA